MEIISFRRVNLGYPVGEDIKNAIKYIDRITPLLLKIVKRGSINIWVRGSSGAILAGLLCKNIKNKCIICHVKKPNESAHQKVCSEDNIADFNIILDDLISSGDTVNAIWNHFIGDKIDVLIVSKIQGDKWKCKFTPDYLITNSISKKRMTKAYKTKQKHDEKVDNISL